MNSICYSESGRRASVCCTLSTKPANIFTAVNNFFADSPLVNQLKVIMVSSRIDMVYVEIFFEYWSIEFYGRREFRKCIQYLCSWLQLASGKIIYPLYIRSRIKHYPALSVNHMRGCSWITLLFNRNQPFEWKFSKIILKARGDCI